MILTGSILLLALINAVEPFPFNLHGSAATFGYNQAIMLPQHPMPPIPPSHMPPQMYTNMHNNAQRFYQQHNSRLFNPAFHRGNQVQQRQVPAANKAPQQFYGLAPAQQQQPQQLQQVFQHRPQQQQPYQQQQQQQFAPIQAYPNLEEQTKLSQPATKDESFLSQLQVVDTQGRLRQLKDFGLGGNGEQPYEPELERQLRNIFDTINRDLENAAFLPVDVNGAHQQLGDMFQNHLNQASHQATPHQSSPVEPPKQEQQQQIGYSFTQPKQNQFQYLKPVRAAANTTPAIRSPAQTIRSSKKSETEQTEQRPIEQQQQEGGFTSLPVQTTQLPENSKTQPAKNQFRAPNKLYQESKGKRPQADFQQTPIVKLREQISQQQLPIAQQAIKAHQTEQRPIQAPIEQQQQGFDDEPLQMKNIEPSKSSSGQKTLGQSISREPAPIEQVPLSQPIEQQQQQYDDDRLTLKAKKFEGWVPIMQQKQPAIEQQKFFEPQLSYDQNKEEQGFDEQKQTSHQREPVEQQNAEFGLDSAKGQGLNRPEVQQPAPKGQGKGNSKWRKSISELAASARSKMANNGVSQREKQPIQQLKDEAPLQQREEIPFQQQREEAPIQQQREEVPLQQQREVAQTLQQQKEESPFQQQKDEVTLQQQREEVPLQQQREVAQTLQQQKEESPFQQQKDEVTLQQQREEALLQQQREVVPTQQQREEAPFQQREEAPFQQQREEVPFQQREETPTKQQREEVPFQQQREVATIQQQREETPFRQQQQQEEQLAQIVDQNRENASKQQRTTKSLAAQKSQQQQSTLGDESFSVSTTPTTDRPVQWSEQPKGRKVRLQLQGDKAKTVVKPSQKARDQQLKTNKQQQSQSRQQTQTVVEAKNSRHLQSRPIKQEIQQVKEEVREQQNLGEPVVPVSKQALQQPKFPVQQKQENFAQVQQDELPEQQKQEFSQQELIQPQIQESLSQMKEESVQQKEDFSQQKEQLTQLKEELPRPHILPQVQDFFGQQQKEELPQQMKEDLPQQSTQLKEGVPEQKELAQQKEDSPQIKGDLPRQPQILTQFQESFGQQQKEESPQQKEELPQQKQELAQQKEELPQQKEEITQQKQESSQQKEEAPLQQSQENAAQQQQETSSDQLGQQQESVSQQPDFTQQQQQQQQNQEDNSNQFQQSQQFVQQEQKQDVSLPSVQQQQENTQQLVQEEEKKQDDVQVQQQRQTDEQQPQSKSQERQQVDEAPQVVVQDTKTQADDEPTPTTTQRPPTRIVRPKGLKRNENRDSETRQNQEVNYEDSAPARPKSRFNKAQQSTRLIDQTQSQQQTNDQSIVRPAARGRFNTRQQALSSGQQQIERYNNEGYLSAHQLLNTYNPLQFEPERISSLNKSTQNSSQNTNVNSSPSGESY